MKVLLIQTASIGDTILATAAAGSIKSLDPKAEVHFLCKDSTVQVLEDHPIINRIWVWEKSGSRKYYKLFRLIMELRKHKFDAAINFQRYLSTTLLLILLRADYKALFRSHFLSFFFRYSIKHVLSGRHEIDRNLELLRLIFPQASFALPVIAIKKPENFILSLPYITIFPGSLWETKKTPLEKWIELIGLLPEDMTVYIMGSKSEENLAELIVENVRRENVYNLCGKFSLREVAFIMKYAVMNYTNDSAPTHLATATGASVTTVFCSTVPDFGFYPISPKSYVVEVQEKLNCRPCGIHGKRQCPKKHFDCGKKIDVNQLLQNLPT
ncbi:MAG: glycosyltransferase family 9 protein [Bacteroidales bacterium]|nr:glycosyltransferase family 9 protein [Bacteroidales bacterium]